MPVRERILVEGLKGTSKSHQWLALARWLKPTGAKFRCIDMDDSIEMMLEETFPDLIPEEGGNVYVYPVYEWPEYQEARDILLKEAEPDDWNVLDMMHMAWKAVQNYYVGEVFKKDIGDYFLEARKAMQEAGGKNKRGKEAKNLQPLDGWKDWQVINKLYDDFIMPFIFRSKAHLYITTSVDTLSRDDDLETRELYGPLGVKPSGQKNLAHQVHTEFLFQQGEEMDTWEITTIKDRRKSKYPNGEYFDHAALLSLPKQYFMRVAGWEV